MKIKEALSLFRHYQQSDQLDFSVDPSYIIIDSSKIHLNEKEMSDGEPMDLQRLSDS